MVVEVLVAPLVGAWIETTRLPHLSMRQIASLPSWERGLKLEKLGELVQKVKVAPLVGAWIETISPL